MLYRAGVEGRDHITASEFLMELCTDMAVQGITSVVQICRRPSRARMQFFVMMEIQVDRDEIRTTAGHPILYPRTRPAIGRRYDSERS